MFISYLNLILKCTEQSPSPSNTDEEMQDTASDESNATAIKSFPPSLFNIFIICLSYWFPYGRSGPYEKYMLLKGNVLLDNSPCEHIDLCSDV